MLLQVYVAIVEELRITVLVLDSITAVAWPIPETDIMTTLA